MLVRRLLALVLAASGLLVVAAPAPAAPERTSVGADGSVLYFQRYVGEDDEYHYQVWALHEDGTRTGVVTDPWFKPYAADLSPDGRRVAVTVGPGSTVSANGIYVLGVDGSGRRNIIAGNEKLSEARDPDWSPDGKRLVFVGLDRDFHYDLWTVRADGSGLARLTRCNCAWENTPRWSPDGTQVLWSPQTYDLAVLDVASGQSRTVYDNAPSGHMNVQGADWSSDGQTIAFSAATDWNTVPLVLHTMPAEGGSPTALPYDQSRSYANPTYAPDGSQIGVTMTSSTYDSYDSDLGSVGPAGPYEVVTALPLPLTEQLASWERSCDCRPGGRFSSLSVHTRQAEGGSLQVSGGLLPGLSGQKIRLVVEKKPGQAWKPLQTLTVTTSPQALYFAQPKRSAGNLCRVTATWAGDAKHDAARERTKPFGC